VKRKSALNIKDVAQNGFWGLAYHKSSKHFHGVTYTQTVYEPEFDSIHQCYVPKKTRKEDVIEVDFVYKSSYGEHYVEIKTWLHIAEDEDDYDRWEHSICVRKVKEFIKDNAPLLWTIKNDQGEYVMSSVCSNNINTHNLLIEEINKCIKILNRVG